ncbi:copia protein [Tanacetum coccineum]
MTIIGTKWVFRNKLDENGIVSQNKARLVAQGYNQQEGIDYDETYAQVARLESIRILLAYACALDFKLFQMDVKSAFLNGFINEEVYVAQPPGFIDFEKPDHVYKLKKALYGLKQAPKAWYDRLKAFLIKHEYKMGMVDNTLFTKKKSSKSSSFVQNRFAYIDKVTMPRATALDHQKTRNYIPSISNDFNQITIRNTMANLEKQYFHEGRIVSPNFENMSHIRTKFRSINFDCLLDINKQIVPRFVLEFYCQLTFTNNSNGQFVVNFVIQNKPFSLTPEEFGQILKIPFKGQASIIEMWSLDHLSVSVPTKVSPELAFDHYLLYDRVMYPLAPHYERKPRADRGKKRPRESNAISSSNTQNSPSSSIQIDDIVEDNDNESSHSNPSSSY